MDYSKIKLVSDLPIARYEAEISEKLQEQGNLIIIGETGSGKTTQIPLIMLKTFSQFQNLSKGKIAITEPRRLAATSVARYVSSLVGDNLGQTVGYKIRFDEIKTEETNIIFMTDGILLREAQIDPLLLDYSVVMVDEAHERNINSDFLIGLLVDIQKKRQEQDLLPLKIIVTSATLEKNKFITFFEKETIEKLYVIEVPGRLFPIQNFYEKNEVFDFEQKAAEKVQYICTRREDNQKQVLGQTVLPDHGDILIFMPGKGEIERTKLAIEALKNFESLNIEIITVHGDLPMEEQNRIFAKSEKRKVVIATNIAETSLTVPGVIFVIDSGLIKIMEFDPHSGINSLVTKLHAKKGLEQRRGRAGRIESGFYFGLYTEKSLTFRQEFPTPEIMRSSLSQIILVMKILGIVDILKFKFIDHPNSRNIESAILELKRLGAIDQKEIITEKGIKMASLPLEPRLSNLIIEANKNMCVDTICTIASFLELKPIFMNLTQNDIYKKLIKERIQFELMQQSIDSAELERFEKNPEIIIEEHELKEIQRSAWEIFNNYSSVRKKLEYKGSDFFTLLKVFNLWIKHEKRPEWASENFLSAETLDEATNIREELLEIAKQNELNSTDKDGNDLRYRIEKTLISAFKFNLLGIQGNGLYRNLKSGEKDIRIHNSSVLLHDRPRYALAFEIIKISEIDSKPKLSAKFLHSIEEKQMQIYFPEIFRREKEFERKQRRHKEQFRNRKFKFNKRRR